MQDKPEMIDSDWKSSPWVIGALIIFFFPLGLYLLWKHPTWSARSKLITSIAFFCCLMLGAISDRPPRNTGQGDLELRTIDASSSSNSKPTDKKSALSGQKLAAFRVVVDHWNEYLDSLGDDALKARWLQKTKQSQEEFISIPFNPKSNSRSLQEGKNLLETFTGELNGVADIMSTYYETGNEFEAANELALWRRLTKHFDELFKKN